MPDIPVYKSQVKEQALPNVRVSTDAPLEAFGGGRAAAAESAAVGGLADQVSKYAETERQKANDSAFSDLDLQASKAQTQIEMASKKMLGKNAADAPDYAKKQWQDVRNNLMEQAGNQEQKTAIDRALKLREANLDKVVNFHMADEFKRYDNEKSGAYINATREEALHNFKDPTRIGQALFQQEAEIMKLGERNGDDAKVTQMKIENAKSGTHSAIVNRFLDTQDDRKAKEYYDANQKSMTEKDKGELVKALEIGSTRGESQRQSDAIMKQTDDLQTAVDKAKEIKDPKVRDATMDRIKEGFSLKKEAKREFDEKVFQSAADQLSSAGRNATIDIIPAATRAAMTVEDENKLKQHVKNLREGIEPDPNGEIYYNLKTMAATKELRDQFLKMNVRTHLNDVTRGEMKEIIDLQADLRKSDPKALKSLDGFRTDQQIVNDTLTQMGVDVTPKPGNKDATRVNQFRGLIDKEVKQIQDQTGKKATNEEVQAIVNRNAAKVKIPGSGFFGFFQTEKGAYEVTAKDIQPEERAQITRALEKMKIPATDANVLRLFNRKNTVPVAE